MARKKFSDTSIARLKPPAEGRAEYWDEEVPGFGLRVTARGTKTWQLMYRKDGRKRRLTLGNYPALSLKLARKAATDAQDAIERGRDPASERSALTGGPMTFEGFARAYLERYAKRHKKTWPADRAMIENDLIKAWGRRPADAIARRDVIALLEEVMARGHPYAANRRLALIRKMFAWGIQVDLISTSPTTGVSAPAREETRTRILNEHEIAALWQAWTEMGWPYGFIFKLILLTAQRRSDIAGLRLDDIGFTTQIWTPPLAKSGAGNVHELPLTPSVLEILTSLPRATSQLVFPSPGDRSKPVSGFSKASERASELSGINDWRTQDLRRTAAVGMARLGVRPELLDQILNVRTTISPGLRGVYQLASDAQEKRQAMEAWSSLIETITSPTDPEKS
ncbi:MAG: integrase arm-type DNA-binding domain-containing protein [Hyphomicrobiales bacterium]|nr:integrase arm-type DNA-binding domain-containing protein [Hyphomicrobiales bacterium]